MKKEIIPLLMVTILLVLPMVFARVHILEIVAKDSIKPVVSITFPQNLTYNYSVNVINYGVSDESGIDRCWYSNDSGIHNYSIQNAGLNFTNVISKEGSNIWSVYCNDTSGNIGQNSVSFFVNLSHSVGPIVYINSCMDLNISGKIYILNKSLNVKGDCFKINAWNITFDLNGKSISGNGKGIGIRILKDNSTVKNGQINNFLISLDSSSSFSKVSNIGVKLSQCVNCGNYGIYIKGNNNSLYNSIISGDPVFNLINNGNGIYLEGNNNFLSNLSVIKSFNGFIIKGNKNTLKSSTVQSSYYGIIGYGVGEINTVKSCGNLILDFDCNGNYNGTSNYFSKIDKCKNGWPVLNKNYNKCK